MNTTTEVINNIKIIKLNSWTKHFFDKVKLLRNRELGSARQTIMVYSFEILAAFLMSPLFIITAFTVFMLAGNSMSTATGFAALQVLGSLEEPIQWIPHFIGTFMEFLVSMRRIQKFLLCDEIHSELVESDNMDLKNKDIDILIEGANFTWAGNKEKTKEEKKDEQQDKDDRDNKIKKDKKDNKGSVILKFLNVLIVFISLVILIHSYWSRFIVMI